MSSRFDYELNQWVSDKDADKELEAKAVAAFVEQAKGLSGQDRVKIVAKLENLREKPVFEGKFISMDAVREAASKIKEL